MWTRLGMIVLTLLIALNVPHECLAGSKLPVVRIGVVLDGSPQKHGWGQLITSGVFHREILKLTQGEFRVQFPKRSLVHGDWSEKKIRRAVDFLLRDQQVDLVLALGVMASHEVAQRKALPKPVVAPFVIDRILQELPFQKGKSGIRNLNYLVSSHTFEQDIHSFKEVTSFKELAVLIDQRFLNVFPRLHTKVARTAKNQNLKITLIPVETSAQAAMSALPANTDAVFVTPLVRFSPLELNKLASGLIERRLPSFSMFGRDELKRGFLTASKPETEVLPIARRIALSVQHILVGEKPEQLPVTFSEKEVLTINMATVRAVGVWPSFRVLTEAELIHDEDKEKGRQLSLSKVVKEAVSVNLELAAADRRVAAGTGEVKEARAELLPQVDVGALGLGLWTRTGEQDGGKPDQAAFATGSINQLIYSDDVWTNYTVREKLHHSTIAERDQLRLDIIQQAGIAYLNILRSQTIEAIVKDDLKLTRVNLERARTRESVGQAAKDEVYRWQSEIANGRRDVLRAQAAVKKAKVTLNRVLNRPLTEQFYTKEATLDDPQLITSHQRLYPYIANPRNFDLFRDFQVKEGVAAAPELRRVVALMEGKARELLNAERAYWVPDIAAGIQAFQKFAETAPSGDTSTSVPLGSIGLAGADIKTIVSATVGLTFPLYAGGAKEAKHSKAREELRKLEYEREALKDRVEESINMTLYDAGASFESINLSQEAAEAAKKNMTMVLDQYANGSVDIIKLINSQNSSLVAKQSAANAVFEFLIDLMKVQRAVGRFDYFTDKQEQEAWFNRLESFFVKAGVKNY